MSVAIKVFAPATVSNVNVGFDILGFAIDGPGDDILVREGQRRGLHIDAIRGDGGQLSKVSSENTAGVAAQALLEHLGLADEAISIEIHKRMPIGSGLGSSAASAVACAFGINEYLGRPLSKGNLLRFAMMGESMADGSWHADNVAPALLGGMVLVRSNDDLDVVQLPVPRGLFCTVIHPHIQIHTKAARLILTADVGLDQHIRQSGNLGAFVAAMFKSDFALLRRSFDDHIIEAQRRESIPHFQSMKELAMRAGAMGFGISGAGPSVFALSDNSLTAEQLGEDIRAFLSTHHVKCTVYQSKVNQRGAFKY